MATTFMNDTDVARRLQRWTAINSLALIAVTYRLWIPQTVFPQVPAFATLCTAPAWCDCICLGVLLVGLLFLSMGHKGYCNTCGGPMVFVSLLALFCLDQHRFQPWAYQLWIFTAVWLCCGIHLRLFWMRGLIVSIYFYSAIGKFDYEFLHTVGQQMLGALMMQFGQDPVSIPDWLRLSLVATFPLAELAVAAGLSWSKSRRIAGWLAICLHMTLIVILGPLGLNHRLGVLLWNLSFAVQVYLLFVVKQQSINKDALCEQVIAPKSINRLQSFLQACCFVMMSTVIVLPITERFGIWDHWPSWALYAPHSSRVYVEVSGQSLHRLPVDLVALIKHPRPMPEIEDMPDWVSIPIDAWSLQTLDTPIYPQARFQLGVARQIASEVNSDFQVRVTLLGSAGRFDGLRQREVFEERLLLERAGANYWLNSMPRRR